jgi:multidrug efflux pump subunit AcrB
VRGLALKFADVMGANPNVGGIVYDWNEPGMVLRVEVDQNRARQLGVSSQDIATMLNNVVGGLFGDADVRQHLHRQHRGPRCTRPSVRPSRPSRPCRSPAATGQPIPCSDRQHRIPDRAPLVWRRNRQPTVTLQASVISDLQPATVVDQLKSAVAQFVAELPAGYSIEIGGTVEESGKGERPIADVVPLMLFLMATVLMLQLQSFQKLFLVVSVAPLGLIGVVVALLLSNQPLGFVAILGVLALIGIIIRNTVILVTQIDAFHTEGWSRGMP